MAENKRFQSRVVNKHDVESNWNRATSFVPMQGEIIVYDVDELHDYERFKIGDGITKVGELPFYLEHELDTIIAQMSILANAMPIISYNDENLIITKGINLNI